jgi:hypothetical protein
LAGNVAGAGLYSALPHALLKVVWGLAGGAIAYLALEPVQPTLIARSGRGQARTEAA